MTPSSAILLGVTLVCLAFVVRNLLGEPSRFGLVTGWLTMLVFAALAAYFCWKGRELRLAKVPAELVSTAQRAVISFGIALVGAAFGVSVQRRRMQARSSEAGKKSGGTL